MRPVKISRVLKEKVPNLQLSCIECDVQLVERNAALWRQIDKKIVELNNSIAVKDISQLPAIQYARKGYKACGKDPARYRLSAEALLRRVLRQKSIYQINNVVDVINLVSISTGFSIGGYDANKIEGTVEFGVGKADELYEAIGRGVLNIEHLPVFRDKKSAFGSPTSDSQRTSITLQTKKLLMIIIDFGNLTPQLQMTTDLSLKLLANLADGSNFAQKIVQ